MKKLNLSWIDEYRVEILFSLGLFFGTCFFAVPIFVVKAFCCFMLAGIIREIYVEAKKG